MPTAMLPTLIILNKEGLDATSLPLFKDGELRDLTIGSSGDDNITLKIDGVVPRHVLIHPELHSQVFATIARGDARKVFSVNGHAVDDEDERIQLRSGDILKVKAGRMVVVVVVVVVVRRRRRRRRRQTMTTTMMMMMITTRRLARAPSGLRRSRTSLKRSRRPRPMITDKKRSLCRIGRSFLRSVARRAGRALRAERR